MFSVSYLRQPRITRIMYRYIEENLNTWKNAADRKPLIVTGARQVGKTYSIEKFGRNSYDTVITYNFQDDVSAREFFLRPHSAAEIRTYIEINHPSYIDSSDTLVFFDEVQLCPELLTSLKYLPSTMSCDFICSGSMPGVQLHNTSSWPVGYVETITLHPMSFLEFAEASGIDRKYIDQLRECIKNTEAVPEVLHMKFNELFKAYMICGGMPEAVLEYKSHGIAASIKVNRRLTNDYRIDIAHYADSKTRIKAQECFDSIPNQLAKDNKKFQYNAVRKGYNARYYEESLNWLESSGLVIKVNRLAQISAPLKAHKELGVFKIYMFDTGILTSQFSDKDISDLLEDSLGMYKGMLYENITAQMLFYSGITPYYYEPNTSSEIDFIIETAEGITPVEVKGGLHTRSKSFNNFIKNHNSAKAYRFSVKNAGKSDDGVTLYMPIYAAEICFSDLQIDEFC